NVTINKCAAWTTAGNEATTRRVVNSLNGAFAVGTVLVRVGIPCSFHVLTCFFVQGPILGIIQRQAKLELEYLFIMVGSLTLLAAFFIYLTDCPYPSGEESASLLGYDASSSLSQTRLYTYPIHSCIRFEEDLRSVPPVLPSPISGSVFLHVKHDLGAANLNPDSYDPEANFIVLLVMIIATLFYGIQMGLAAFLFQYLEFVMALGYGANLHSICCSIMCVFWLALALSYSLFTSCLFEHMKSLGWLFFLNVLCVVTMAGVIFGQNLFGPDYVVAALTFHLVLFAVFISPLFTATIQGLTNVVNPDLLARVSSLLVFGCFCGEAFIPVLMGFFMGDYSGSGFGAGTIVYITFALTITMMTTTGWFWYSVVTKQQVVDGVGAAAPSPAKPLK
ncbi:hypothetical protein DYB28_007162, partial [Aphanomyces astaci]